MWRQQCKMSTPTTTCLPTNIIIKFSIIPLAVTRIVEFFHPSWRPPLEAAGSGHLGSQFQFPFWQFPCLFALFPCPFSIFPSPSWQSHGHLMQSAHLFDRVPPEVHECAGLFPAVSSWVVIASCIQLQLTSISFLMFLVDSSAERSVSCLTSSETWLVLCSVLFLCSYNTQQ